MFFYVGCCCFTSHETIHLLLLAFQPDPSSGLPLQGLTYFLISAQLTAEWLATLSFLNFWVSHFAMSASILRGPFLLPGIFYVDNYSLILEYLRLSQPASFIVPALTEFSLQVDTWFWTTDILFTNTLVFQACLWTIKYRVKTDLLNKFLVELIFDESYV